MDDLHFLAVEAGADVAGPFQFAVVVDAQGEGAEGLALAFDHAAEDELGGGGELELYPVGGGAVFVKTGGALGDDAFEPLDLGGFQELGPGAGEVFGIANDLIGLKDFFQQTLALGQGFAAKVAAIEIEQIEQEKDGGEEAG